MSEEEVRCPICGTKNEAGAEKCKMCKTLLGTKDGGPVKVQSPKSRGRTVTIVDIEDPLTRKRLEELTLIPGVNRKKALLLYESGIHSMEDFLQKAFHGERYSENFSRTVANKLLVRSMRKGRKKQQIPCPSCQAPNPTDAEKCNVCGFGIKDEMDSVNMEAISGKLSESVSEILTKLNESDDFKALPEEMKAQLATIVESDNVDLELEKPKAMDRMGIDLEKIDQEAKAEQAAKQQQAQAEEAKEKEQEAQAARVQEEKTEPEPAEPEPPKAEDKPPKEENTERKGRKKEVPALFKTKLEEAITAKQEPGPEAEPAPLTGAGEKAAAPAQPDAKKDKVRKILTEKMDKWRKAGYDVSGLETYLDDVEGFKSKAKEVLSAGKVVKARYKNQLEMWREKGFDVSVLEPLLETDLDEFSEKAKEILKKQKKK